MFTKNDYLLAILIGFFAGMLAIPIFINIGRGEVAILLALPWVVALLFALGMGLGGALGKKIPVLLQFTKFVVVGFLNTTIDFGILNGLSLLTGITKGFVIGGVNVPGVSLALFNAYLWNKLWVFAARDDKGVFHDAPKFLAVSGSGVLLNSGIVIALTTFAPGAFGLEPRVWLNVAKVGATLVSLVWNFLGYKFIVFAHRGNLTEESRPPTAPL